MKSCHRFKHNHILGFGPLQVSIGQFFILQTSPFCSAVSMGMSYFSRQNISSCWKAAILIHSHFLRHLRMLRLADGMVVRSVFIIFLDSCGSQMFLQCPRCASQLCSHAYWTAVSNCMRTRFGIKIKWWIKHADVVRTKTAKAGGVLWFL